MKIKHTYGIFRLDFTDTEEQVLVFGCREETQERATQVVEKWAREGQGRGETFAVIPLISAEEEK